MNNQTVTPFGRNDGSTLFDSAGHREAMARLQLTVNNCSLGMLTGEVGSGKSALIRHLAHKLDPMSHQLVYLSIAGLNPRDFYGETLYHLRELPPFSLTKAKRLWYEVLETRRKQGEKKLVVIIDEAHALNPTMIMELRFVMNHQMDAVSLFPILLVGQPELRRIMRLKNYEAIAQRIQLQYHLTGMTIDETVAYIHYEMKRASMDKPLFSESATQMIHTASQGIPRLINNICGQALYDASHNRKDVIEEKHISRILTDMERQRGTHS